MVNTREENYLKGLMKATTTMEKKVVMVKGCQRNGGKILVNGVGLSCETNINGFTNEIGQGTVISVDSANIIYLENLQYFVEFKATLEKLNSLCSSLQGSIGNDGTGAEVVTNPQLVSVAKELADTIQPLISKLP